jgi:TfoX/Sxy family transcriptional regulator of competence genes
MPKQGGYMAYDEQLAARIRAAIEPRADFSERKMFGGLAFMAHGHMYCGIIGNELMARVGVEQYADALAQPHARELGVTGKPMRGMVQIAPAGFATNESLAEWIRRGLAFVDTLPPK